MVESCSSSYRAKSIFSFFFSFLFFLAFLRSSSAILYFKGQSVSLSFEDVEARFTVAINGSGICGTLHVAEPFDSCSILQSAPNMGEHMDMRFVLIARGTCTFEEKVRNAQDGGFDAAIIYDNRDKRNLISMVGNSGGIHVHAVFISKAAGEALLKFSQSEDGRCCMSPSAEKIAWAVVVFSLLSVLVIAVVLVTCFIARNRHLRVRSTQHNNLKRKSQLVKALPTLTYGAPFDGKCASEMCAVCLEDYKAGETLRVLPCHHDFHAVCVDSWLTSWKAFCPVCKRDANIEAGCHQVCEHTPLLSCSSRPALPS